MILTVSDTIKRIWVFNNGGINIAYDEIRYDSTIPY